MDRLLIESDLEQWDLFGKLLHSEERRYDKKRVVGGPATTAQRLRWPNCEAAANNRP